MVLREMNKQLDLRILRLFQAKRSQDENIILKTSNPNIKVKDLIYIANSLGMDLHIDFKERKTTPATATA